MLGRARWIKTVRQRILNERNFQNLLLADVAQNGIWAGIFAAFEAVMQSTAGIVLFPSVVFLSLYKTYYFHWKSYKHDKNKNILKKTSFGIQLLSTAAESLAVSVAVAAYFGTQFLVAAAVPALFIGAMGLRCVSHLAQTIYHGFGWALSDANTKKNEKHKAQFWKNLRATTVLGVVGAAVGLLMLTPLSLGAIIAVKAVAVTVASVNAVKIVHSIYKNHQQEKQRIKALHVKIKETRIKRHAVREKMIQELQPLLKPSEDVEQFIPEFTESDYIGDPLKYDKTRADFGPNASLRAQYQTQRYQRLKKDDVDDLIRTLEASDEINYPKETLLSLLQQSKHALLKDLKIEGQAEDVTLNEEGQLVVKENKSSFFSCLQRAKRLDKLHAVLLLEALVNKDEKSSIYIKEKNGWSEIGTVYDLMDYLKRNKKLENVFHSLIGKLQKLFTLVDYYLQHKDLHPDSRLTYEKSRMMYAAPAA